MKIFLVGGFIRDKLLGSHNLEKDWIITQSNFKSILKKNFKLVGKDFPVFLHPSTKEEYALARQERKIKKGHNGFKCYFSKKITLKNDIYRRDIGINTMILNKNGKLKNYIKSQLDFKNKIIKNISLAFAEDPLRIFRISRFLNKYYKNGFLISSSTFFLTKKIVLRKEIKYLTNERIIKEIYNSLQFKNNYNFFYFLHITKTLKINFKELDNLIKHSLHYSKNIYQNIWTQICNSNKFIQINSNNNNLLLLIIFIKLLKNYNHGKIYLQNLKDKFYLSKKFIKYIKHIIIINYFFIKFYKIKPRNIIKIYKKTNMLKDKIKTLNTLIIYNAENKSNNQIHYIYKKYIILEILDKLVKTTYQKKHHLKDDKIFENKIYNILKKYKKNII